MQSYRRALRARRRFAASTSSGPPPQHRVYFEDNVQARRQLLKKDKAGSSPVAEGAAAAAQCCARLPAGFSSNLPVVVVTTQSVRCLDTRWPTSAATQRCCILSRYSGCWEPLQLYGDGACCPATYACPRVLPD